MPRDRAHPGQEFGDTRLLQHRGQRWTGGSRVAEEEGGAPPQPIQPSSEPRLPHWWQRCSWRQSLSTTKIGPGPPGLPPAPSVGPGVREAQA